jgi:hypothetical protein
MTFKEAYIYMYATLQEYWRHTHDNDLAILISGFNLWSPISNNEKPGDPAAWDDWLKAVKKVTDLNSLNDIETLQSSIYLLRDYMDNQGFKLKKVIHYLEDELRRQLSLKNK